MEINKNLEARLNELEPRNRDLLMILLNEIEKGSYHTYIEDKIRNEVREIVAEEINK
ncbi:MAG: hypothetical protein KKF57_00145 [Firmicutes bacterium]|nr:hypothetical protein [Bacillota bacterium]